MREDVWQTRGAHALGRHSPRPWLGAARHLLILSVIACTTTAEPSHAVESPDAVVQETADAVVGVLADKSLSPEQRRAKVQQIVYDHFDFDTLARLTLARHWRQLSPEKQKEFVDEFKKHLSATYGRRFDSYTNERVVVTGDRKEKDGDWTVTSKIVSPGADDIQVDYRLRKGDGSWKVIDVIVEGVSLVINFRSQFDEIITNQGPQRLIELLREKNITGEPLKAS
jgi:phospholipid transport system substrate-binding protein